jgi:serine protein kinase
MSETGSVIKNISAQQQQEYQEQKVILSFNEFLDIVRESPEPLIRNSSSYLLDTFEYFGMESLIFNEKVSVRKFKLFEHGSIRNGPIIGGEWVQDELYNILRSFARQGRSNKLILLHGPNGSAKSCTLETIGDAMANYSATNEGAVYRFNWIFPSDKDMTIKSSGEPGPIGFGGHNSDYEHSDESFAHYDEGKISCKIHSEYKDNPLFLIPMPHRETLLRKWIGQKRGISPDEVDIPIHFKIPGLSKRNQLIFENILAGYDGDLTKVFRHVQIERFFYSAQYRVGIASVEPRMSIDAVEQQLTMDRNIANLPSILSNIRFHEAFGPLIDANRGILEFSDMLKRPVESFKYLLTTIEKNILDLPSSTANLDLVFFGTTNEQHLDAFKTMPDFSSFRSRFHLLTVPYLLRPSLEMNIYSKDIETIQKNTPIAPHTLSTLCTWAVMTRLKQPDPEHYPTNKRALISRLEPEDKIRLYEAKQLRSAFKSDEDGTLSDMRWEILSESKGTLVYEGRFGASPREVKQILYHAAQIQGHKTLTPVSIFEELEQLVKDRTIYEFLQFESRGKYHDASGFINIVKEEFARVFERELTASMSLVAEEQYDVLLKRYIDNAVAFVKKEQLYNDSTSSYEPPNESLMRDVEKIIGINISAVRHRELLLSKVAAYKLENKERKIELGDVFADYLKKIYAHYHREHDSVVKQNTQNMLMLSTESKDNLASEELIKAQEIFRELENRFNYDYDSALTCLKFLVNWRKSLK